MDLTKEINKNENSFLKNMGSYYNEEGLPDKKNEFYKYTAIKDWYQDITEHFSTPNLTITGTNFKINELNAEDLKKYRTSFIKEEDDITYDSVLALTSGLTKKVYEINITSSSNHPIVIDHSNGYKYSSNIIIINVTKDVKASLIEKFSSDHEGIRNNATKIFLAHGSTLEHMIYQNNNGSFNQYSHTQAVIKKDATYKNCFYSFGGNQTRNTIHIKLSASGAHGEAHGLHIGKDSQHIDTLSFIEHLAPHTTSQQLYKSVLDDTARSVFMGRVKVHPKAQLISSEQLNKNLLLSNLARANSLPQLEIFADDVKCSHGSTTGQLSEDELFYFTARGIEEKKARKMLALGFVKDVILKSSNDSFKTELEQKFLANFETRIS